MTRQKTIDLFFETSKNFLAKQVVNQVELYDSHDVHAYLRLSKFPEHVIHLQGYPGLSDKNLLTITGALMDYNKLQEIRLEGKYEIGNEHLATVNHFFIGAPGQVAYNTSNLIALLEAEEPRLKIE